MPETEAERKARMTWWTEARFGMFIHWGLYALPARHEWVKSREQHHRRGLRTAISTISTPTSTIPASGPGPPRRPG